MQVNDITRERLRRLAEATVGDAKVLSLFVNLDPREFATPPARSTEIRSLLDRAARLERREDVRGVQTTHYKATIDLEKYPDIVPAKDRAAARSTIATLTKALGGSKSPVEFWIDEDDLVRRYVQSLRLKVGGATSSLRQRLEFYDYGTKADIAVPPADEVQDLTDIAAAGIGGSGATP